MTNIGGVWSKGMDIMTDKQLYLDGGHDQVNVTLGLVVHNELALWITDTVCRIYKIISALILQGCAIVGFRPIVIVIVKVIF